MVAEMIRIRWWGHACFEISNGKVIVIDPHDGISIGIPPPKTKADVILVTHEHFDHNQTRIVEKEGSVVVRGEKTVNGLSVRALTAYHDKDGGARRGKPPFSYLNMEGSPSAIWETLVTCSMMISLKG